MGHVDRRRWNNRYRHRRHLIIRRVVRGCAGGPIWPCARAADRDPVVFDLHLSERLCPNFEQLFILRGLHGLGFGGEWATGAVLMGEVIRDKYCGRGVGFVQTGAAVGPGLAALVYAGPYAILPGAIAWRALFAVGILPALLVLWIRRSIPESEAFEGRRDRGTQPGISHLLSAFRGRYLWLTIKVSLMVMGAQGGVWAINFWMPTYLRTVRHLSASGTGLFVAVQACGALIGFLIGAFLADAIGRKWTFMISALATITMVFVYLYVPVSDTALLLQGIPLNASILMKFAPMGPYMTELYPTDIRGTAQGFCYNAGRAIGSVFMTAIGFATAIMPLGTAIAVFSTLAHVLMIVMLPLRAKRRTTRRVAGLRNWDGRGTRCAQRRGAVARCRQPVSEIATSRTAAAGRRGSGVLASAARATRGRTGGLPRRLVIRLPGSRQQNLSTWG